MPGKNNPYGVLTFLPWNHSWNDYRYAEGSSIENAVALMRRAGIGWVRMDFLWEDIEPVKGSFNFKKYDFILDVLARNQIQTLGVLGYSVSWAALNWNNPPRKITDFVRFAEVLARQYCKEVHFWEIWNEPDHPEYFTPQDGLYTYTQILKAVYPKLKKINPQIEVLTGGLTMDIPQSLAKIYEHGGKGSFDILAIHPFGTPLKPKEALGRIHSTLQACRKEMKDQGESKKIWITELGCPGVPIGLKVQDWWLGPNPDTGMQAAWLKEILGEQFPAMGVEKIFWAFWQDMPGFWKSGVDYFGLVDSSGKPKSAYQAYRQVCSLGGEGLEPSPGLPQSGF
jgi:polysaccharide biosynthesis protein PslG